MTFSDTCGVKFRRHAVGRDRPKQAELTPADGWASCHGFPQAERVFATPQNPQIRPLRQAPEGRGRIAAAQYGAEAVLSNPSAFKAEEIRTLRDQITSNLERAWEITGRSEDKLTGMMVQISQVVAKEFGAED